MRAYVGRFDLTILNLPVKICLFFVFFAVTGADSCTINPVLVATNKAFTKFAATFSMALATKRKVLGYNYAI
jgi:hypothetical protein